MSAATVTIGATAITGISLMVMRLCVYLVMDGILLCQAMAVGHVFH
jgi:hypothetical protein